MLKVLTRADLPEVARVHEAAFPKSALTKLGCEAVSRYYEWQLEGPHDCVALAVADEGRLLGFCFAGIFRSATGGFVRRNQAFLAKRILVRPWLWANPLIRNRLMGGLRSLRPHPAVTVRAGEDVEPEAFGILSIAVHPEAQGRGVGRELMEACEAEARRKGFPFMQLTVATDNDSAIGFYEKAGWKRTPDDATWAGRMEKRLEVAAE